MRRAWRSRAEELNLVFCQVTGFTSDFLSFIVVEVEHIRFFHGAIQLKGSMTEPNKFHIYETEKITRKASDAAEYIELFGSSTRDRHARHI